MGDECFERYLVHVPYPLLHQQVGLRDLKGLKTFEPLAFVVGQVVVR
jgi:hypothetical protein